MGIGAEAIDPVPEAVLGLLAFFVSLPIDRSSSSVISSSSSEANGAVCLSCSSQGFVVLLWPSALPEILDSCTDVQP
jgi:hypothetical protein